jgi:hypothetical protein
MDPFIHIDSPAELLSCDAWDGRFEAGLVRESQAVLERGGPILNPSGLSKCREAQPDRREDANWSHWSSR